MAHETIWCREASRKASLLLDSTVMDESRTPLKLPHFEMAVMVAATKALESWRDEALEGGLPDTPFNGDRERCEFSKNLSPFASIYSCAERLSRAVTEAMCLGGAVARTIVAMEQGYVTAAFFRHRMYERYRQWEENDRLGRMLDQGDLTPPIYSMRWYHWPRRAPGFGAPPSL